MAAPTDPSQVLRGFASGIPEPQVRWDRGPGLGGRPNPEPKPAEPKAEPKPTSASTAAPDADTKPDTKTDPKPDADTKPKAEPKAEPKVNPRVSKPATALGLPPGTDLRTGEPLKGVKGIVKGQWSAGQHYAGKGAEKAAAKLAEKGLMGGGALKTAAKLVPGVGSLVAAYSAFQNFKSGDYVGAVLNALGMIPGPVGWIGIGASLIWEASGFGDRYGEWAKPDGIDTHMLQAEAKDVANVKEMDAKLRTAQQQVFSFQDGPTGSVWDSAPPPPIQLSTPEVVAAATDYLTGISDHFAAIDKAMTDAGEQYFSEQRAALAPHLQAMAKLKGEVKLLTDQLTAMDKGAKTAYDAVTGANKAARGQLASSGSLTDAGPAQTMETQMQQGLSAVKAAEDKISKLWSDTPPALVLVRNVDGTTQAAKPAEKPVTPISATPAVTPSVQTPAITPAKTETPNKNTDDISKLLSQLGQQKPSSTPTSNPLGSGGSGLGGGSPLGTGTGQGTGGGTPLSQSKPDTSEKSEPKKLADDKKETDRKTTEPRKLADDKSLSTPKPEQAKAAVPADAKPAGAVPAAVAAPGAAAPTPAQQNAAAAAQAAEPNKEVDVKGQKVTFPDAKTAKLAELLSKADPTHPMSLADAAKAAGLTPPVPGQDPGKQVNPAEAKPGDVMVAGDKNYLLLGDGKFYDLTDYKVVGASELPQNLGDRAGYFHLNDPNPGAPVPADQGQQPPAAPQGPVSGQTGGVQQQVPGATAAPAGPQPGQPAAGSSAAPTGGVPSVGAPGAPKPGGSGPANAESTATGTGQGGPSTGGGALDPGAIR